MFKKNKISFGKYDEKAFFARKIFADLNNLI